MFLQCHNHNHRQTDIDTVTQPHQTDTQRHTQTILGFTINCWAPVSHSQLRQGKDILRYCLKNWQIEKQRNRNKSKEQSDEETSRLVYSWVYNKFLSTCVTTERRQRKQNWGNLVIRKETSSVSLFYTHTCTPSPAKGRIVIKKTRSGKIGKGCFN